MVGRRYDAFEVALLHPAGSLIERAHENELSVLALHGHQVTGFQGETALRAGGGCDVRGRRRILNHGAIQFAPAQPDRRGGEPQHDSTTDRDCRRRPPREPWN